ncbi:hypothetical protein GCM10010384_55800 [Streptomyces djakartensis]|uniref:Uncharacterized protein n=1 Tax=Streptomyces djakartensis TaxID=68193 RepID=A0ABQ3AC57_9ACTN|nr:hypothetical protein GCM10010384_55800 [Streptomyces djakartensis]
MTIAGAVPLAPAGPGTAVGARARQQPGRPVSQRVRPARAAITPGTVRSASPARPLRPVRKRRSSRVAETAQCGPSAPRALTGAVHTSSKSAVLREDAGSSRCPPASSHITSLKGPKGGSRPVTRHHPGAGLRSRPRDPAVEARTAG